MNFLTHFTLLLVNYKLILIEPSFYTYCVRFIGKLFLADKNTLKCLSIGTPNTINFPFVPNGKLMVLGVPIFKHIRVNREKKQQMPLYCVNKNLTACEQSLY